MTRDDVQSRIALVHRLQRERGATCAWVAGSGTLTNRGMRLPLQCGSGSLVADLRRRTDRYAHERIGAGLARVRAIADQYGIDPGQSASTFYSTFNGYSEMIEEVSKEAFKGAGFMLKEVAKLKELYAQQRGFLLGSGSLEARSLAALPPRAVVYFVQLQEQLLMTLGVVRLAASRKGTAPEARERLEQAIMVDDERMVELSSWLRTDEFNLDALRTRFEQSGSSLSCEACWIVWTAHIDKLQTLENELVKEHFEVIARWDRIRSAATTALVAAVVMTILMSTLLFLGHVSFRMLAVSVVVGGVGAGAIAHQGRIMRRGPKLPTPMPTLSDADSNSMSAGNSDSSFAAGSASPSSHGNSSNPSSRQASRQASDALNQAMALDENPSTVLERLREALPDGAIARATRNSGSSSTSRPRMAVLDDIQSQGSSSNHPVSEIEEDIDALHARLARPGDARADDDSGTRPSEEGLQFNMSFLEDVRGELPLPAPREGAQDERGQQRQQQGSYLAGDERSSSGGSTQVGGVRYASPGASPSIARRASRPLGLVAHRPPSELDERGQAEAIAALLDPAVETARRTSSGNFSDPGAELSAAPTKSRSPTDKSPSLGSPVIGPVGASPGSYSSSLTASPRVDRRSISPKPQKMSDAALEAEMEQLEKLMDAFERPDVLDDFVELKTLGRGAFGQALLMQSRVTNQRIVAKRLQYDALSLNDIRLLENEVKVCARLRHPNIAHYFGTVVRSDKVFICLEYAAGGTLGASIDRHHERGQPFDSTTATLWIQQIAAAVSHMHSKRILHRDLSANNVFLAGTGNIKVGDFGLSKANNQSRSATGHTVCGTPNYFSPEMINGDPYGTPSDAWSVGLLAFEILTLEHPFSGGSLASMLKRIASSDYDHKQLERAPHPPEIKRVASNTELLHPDPKERLTLDALLEREPFMDSSSKKFGTSDTE